MNYYTTATSTVLHQEPKKQTRTFGTNRKIQQRLTNNNHLKPGGVNFITTTIIGIQLIQFLYYSRNNNFDTVVVRGFSCKSSPPSYKSSTSSSLLQLKPVYNRGTSFYTSIDPSHTVNSNKYNTVRYFSGTMDESTPSTGAVIKETSKAGVATPEEVATFVQDAGERLLVIDVRNPDATVEPGDQKSLAVGPLPNPELNIRPKAVHIVWDREQEKLVNIPPSLIAEDGTVVIDPTTPIITHCGGGGRGQLVKEYLQDQYGFTNIINGGGPKETENWNIFGSK